MSDVDPLTNENHRSDRLLSDFLGLKDEQLCPVFGFDRNTYYLLALQVIVGFAILKLCRMLSESFAAPKEVVQDEEPEEGLGERRASAPPSFHHSPPSRKRSMSGSSDPFASMPRGLSGGDPFASSASSALQTQGRSRQQNFVSFSSTYEDVGGGQHVEDREIAALNEEFQQRLAKILQDRRQQEQEIFKSPAEQAMMSQDASQLEFSQLDALTMGDEEPAGIPILPIVYWVWQVIMSFVLMVTMIISMTQYNGAWTELMRSRGSWAHYNLFIFAYMNSGMLPTGVQAVCHMITSLLEMQSRRGPGGATRLLQIAPGEEEADDRAGPDAAEVNKKLFLLMLPMLLPLAAAALTHVVPFCFCYPWVLVLAGVIAAALIMLTRFGAAQLKISRRLEMDALMLITQLVACLFVHSSVPVMIRVFGGEWRHGGYSNQLFSRVFRGEFEHVPCTWFSFSHGVDAVLRWT
mmetsp:Transcript_82500/g.223527  ORF Transcript_82500/g.223527 Transcript_82500/m.223527 type:complete len:464 (+) Transcript_82500:184-1575(+)